jgi:hypothetical protein
MALNPKLKVKINLSFSQVEHLLEIVCGPPNT